MLYQGSDTAEHRTLHKYKQSTCLGTALPVFIMPKLRLFNTQWHLSSHSPTPTPLLKGVDDGKNPPSYLCFSEQGRAVGERGKGKKDKQPKETRLFQRCTLV